MAAEDLSMQTPLWTLWQIWSPSKIKAKQVSLAWTLLTFLLLVCNDQCLQLTGLRTDAGRHPCHCAVTGVTSQMERSHCGPGHSSRAALLSPQLSRVSRVRFRVFYPLGQKCIPTVLHTGLLPLMHPLPGLSECSWYKPSDKQHIQHYQQHVMKGMSWQSAAESQDKNHPGI